MRDFVSAIAIMIVIVVAGCAAGDALTRGRNGADSAIVAATRAATDAVPELKKKDPATGISWGEIILGAVVIGQNAYLQASKKKAAKPITP